MALFKRFLSAALLLLLVFSACTAQKPTGGTEMTTTKSETAASTFPTTATTASEAKPADLFLTLEPTKGEKGARIENFCNVTAITGEATTARSVWGGNQNRLATDGECTYFAYFTSGEIADRVMDFALYMFKDNTWTRLGGDTCSGDAAIPLLNAKGELYVASSGDNKPHGAKKTYAVWEYDPSGVSTDDASGGVLVRHLYGKSAGLSNYNYYAACIDRDSGIIYMLFCGGDPVDVLAYNTFDTNTKTFGTPRIIELDYRHCYIYMQPDGEGGLSLQGGRDVIGSLLGYAPKAGGEFPYVFDSVRFWHISDTESGVPDVDIVIRAENPEDYVGETTYPRVINNFTGDCYFDENSGKTHILYHVDAKETDFRSMTYHAVIKDGEKIKDDLLWDHASSLRMTKDKEGNFWLLEMHYNDNVLKLHKGDSAGENFSFHCSFELPTDAPLSYAGLYLAAPRGGTLIDDFVDVVYPTGEDTWHYFRLHFN